VDLNQKSLSRSLLSLQSWIWICLLQSAVVGFQWHVRVFCRGCADISDVHIASESCTCLKVQYWTEKRLRIHPKCRKTNGDNQFCGHMGSMMSGMAGAVEIALRQQRHQQLVAVLPRPSPVTVLSCGLNSQYRAPMPVSR
jgi:hypothetical protein